MIARINHTLKLLLLIGLCSWNLQSQTTVSKINGAWQLHVDGNPFEVKGVTFGYDTDVANYNSYFKDLKFLGVNAIRTWATGKDTKKLLDSAQDNNIKVMLGIWMRHGRPGMEADDSFDYIEDKNGMEAMYINALNVVETYKDHPAVLTWGIGNEVYLNIGSDAEKKAYSELLERICSQIKKVDPNHPITSVEAWTFGLDWWQKYVPSIDIYGLNSYGRGAGLLNDELLERNIDKPYMITEFGVTGEWDIKNKKNGIVVEPTDQQKYDAIATGYHDWIKNKPNCLGVYVFHYASGKDHIAPWLFTHYNNMYRPQYWAIREAYTGQKPINNVPTINKLELSSNKGKNGEWISVILETTDVENDSLEVRFSFNQRTGSRKRRDQVKALEYRGNQANGFEIKLPDEHGPIKVYAIVTDSYNNAGIASTTVVVDNKNGPRTYLVAKTELPFYVYKDGMNNPYAPSAYMGNQKAMNVDMNHKGHVHSGTSALKVHYNANSNWYGLGLVDPPNDWGDTLGGYDITGAKTFSFWAKASKKGVVATIGFGLIGKNKPYPDTAKKSVEVKLSTQWKKYTINTRKQDLSCIRSGLTLFASSYGSPQTIYLDEIKFE